MGEAHKYNFLKTLNERNMIFFIIKKKKHYQANKQKPKQLNKKTCSLDKQVSESVKITFSASFNLHKC